jgi:hypothetical protein
MNFDDDIKIIAKIAHNAETNEYEKKKVNVLL